MIEAKVEILIDRPVSEVFRRFTDVKLFDQWTDMTGTHLVSGNTLQQGSQVEATTAMGPLKQALTFEVVNFQENRRFAWKSTSKGPLQFEADWAFEPQGVSSARMIYAGRIRLGGVLKLSEGLLAAEIKRTLVKEHQRFKELVEKS